MTSCFVYKIMGLTFHDRINTQLIYRFELAQMVARSNTKPQRIYSGFESHRLLFFYLFFFIFYFSMVARYCVLAGNSIYLKNTVYHVAAFLFRLPC